MEILAGPSERGTLATAMVESALRPQRLSAPDRAQSAASLRPVSRGGAGWVYACVVVQLLGQLALLVPQLSSGRVVIRSMALGTSLAFLVLAPGRIPLRARTT